MQFDNPILGVLFQLLSVDEVDVLVSAAEIHVRLSNGFALEQNVLKSQN